MPQSTCLTLMNGVTRVLFPITRSVGHGQATLRSNGRSRSPLILVERATAWSCTGPSGSKPRGEIRSQFSHVTDIAPTTLEAASLPFPKMVNGTEQRPFDGTSLVYTFDDANAK